MYDMGRGVTQDYKAALKWYKKSSELDHPEAPYNIGLMYYNGQGVAQDNKQALFWYRQAAEKSHIEAQFLLSAMYALGQGVPQDDMQAYVWGSLAAVGFPDAAKIRDNAASRLDSASLSKAKVLAASYAEQYQVS